MSIPGWREESSNSSLENVQAQRDGSTHQKDVGDLFGKVSRNDGSGKEIPTPLITKSGGGPPKM